MKAPCCSTPKLKEKKFGVKVCRDRKCEDLQRDPKYPDSPQMCAVTHGMPGAMSMCVKEMPPEQFIRHISGQLNSSPYNSPNPGVRNCPKECPYKIFVEGEKFVFERGKPVSSKVPAKIGKCALTGKTLGEFGSCPCNVLGNPQQEDHIRLLTGIVKSRLECGDDIYRGLCTAGVCPDGKDRGGPNTDDDRCPILRVPFKSLHGSAGCPLWRIPLKLLPAPASPPEQEPDERLARGKAIREEVLENRETMKKMSTRKSSLKEKPDAPAKPDPIVVPSPAEVTQKEKIPSRKLAQKEKKRDSRQLTLDVFSPGACMDIITARVKKSTRPPGAGTGGGPQTVQKCCGTCGHHKSRKTFYKTCPRLGELLFVGGTKSAKILMDETAIHGCGYWVKERLTKFAEYCRECQAHCLGPDDPLSDGCQHFQIERMKKEREKVLA